MSDGAPMELSDEQVDIACREAWGWPAENVDRVNYYERAAYRAGYRAGRSAGTGEPVAWKIIEDFGRRVTDMFEQLERGNWRDDHDHDVRLNAAMMALRQPVLDAIAYRSTYSASDIDHLDRAAPVPPMVEDADVAAARAERLEWERDAAAQTLLEDSVGAPSETAARCETAWLIERGSPAEYWMGRQHDCSLWTTFAGGATRFAREEDARRLISFMAIDHEPCKRNGYARAVEHMWMDGPTATANSCDKSQQTLVSPSLDGPSHRELCEALTLALPILETADRARAQRNAGTEFPTDESAATKAVRTALSNAEPTEVPPPLENANELSTPSTAVMAYERDASRPGANAHGIGPDTDGGLNPDYAPLPAEQAAGTRHLTRDEQSMLFAALYSSATIVHRAPPAAPDALVKGLRDELEALIYDNARLVERDTQRLAELRAAEALVERMRVALVEVLHCHDNQTTRERYMNALAAARAATPTEKHDG